MKAYASRTGTQRNLAGLRDAGWGLLISAYGVHRDEGWADYMLDNGAWSAHTGGHAWDPAQFEDLLSRFGSTSSQTVAPDIVAGGPLSLDLSLSWLDRLLDLGPAVLIPAQDGIVLEDLRKHVGPRVGIAVGGTAAWKWRTLSQWCRLGHETGARVHVLRAGSARMISWAKACGAYSFDGSGPSKWGDCLPRLEGSRARPAQRPFRAFDLSAPFKPRSK